MSKTQRGVTKSQWLETAMETLKSGTISDIAVEKLAKTLGIAKAGFYWHFKNRDDLLFQLLNYWIYETTQVISENPMLKGLEPKTRLITTAEMILKHHFAQYDPAFLQWAQ